MNSNSNGQSPISVDDNPVGQTQRPAPPQQPSVPSNTHTITGSTQNQPHTRAHTRTATRVKRQFWFRILSGGDNLLTLAEKLLVANFSAVISLLASRLDGSQFRYTKSFTAVVACFAIGFTCNIFVILIQKHSLIAAKIGGYAGELSSVIGFLIMMGILLPPTFLCIVWSAAAAIFLSFLYHFANNWVATEDGNVDTEDENVDTEGEIVDTEGEIVLFYWGGQCVYDDRGSVSYNCDPKKWCKVEKGTTLPQLEEMIKPKVAPNEENVQLKFNYRIPRVQSPGLEYALAPINDDTALNLVLNERKRLPSILLTLEFYVYRSSPMLMLIMLENLPRGC